MLTTAPPPNSRISGTAALVHRNGPVRLTASTRFQSSSDVSSSGANTAIPALLTSASSRPNRAPTLATASATAPASETSQGSAIVESGFARSATAPCSKVALDVEQRHAPALGEKPFGHREPDAARGAGDQSDFLRGRGHRRSTRP